MVENDGISRRAGPGAGGTNGAGADHRFIEVPNDEDASGRAFAQSR
jgi:hypothetical protein